MSIWKDPAQRTDKIDKPLYPRTVLEPLLPKITQALKDHNSNSSIIVDAAVVFGSYAAGAEKCHDLDIALVLPQSSIKPSINFNEARNLLTRKLRRISKKIEVHFIDPAHAQQVNWATLVHGPMLGDIDPENQSYIFSGPCHFFFVRDGYHLSASLDMNSYVVTNNAFVTGVVVGKFLDFLSCYSYLGYVYFEKEDPNKLCSVVVKTLRFIGGSDLERFGINKGAFENEMKATIETTLFRMITDKAKEIGT